MDKKDHELAVRGKEAKTGKVANILFFLFSRPMPNVLCDVEGFLPAQKGGGGVMMFEAWSSIVFFFFWRGNNRNGVREGMEGEVSSRFHTHSMLSRTGAGSHRSDRNQ